MTSPTEPEGAFRFRIEGIFHLHGRGTTVIGTIQHGRIKKGDHVQVVGGDGASLVCEGVEFALRKDGGESVALILPSLSKAAVKPGDLLVGESSE